MEQNAALRKRKFEEKLTAQNKHTCFEDMDETDIFFLSLARMTKQLPKAEQAAVKITVSTAILQAELRSAQAQSAPTPTPSSSYALQPLFSPHDNSRPSTSSSSYSVQPLPSPHEYSRPSSESSNMQSALPPQEYDKAGHGQFTNVSQTSNYPTAETTREEWRPTLLDMTSVSLVDLAKYH